jgi:hypothetical protein
MYIIVQEEYSGYCEAFGDSKGLFFAPSLKGYLEGKIKLPSSKITSSSDKIVRNSVTTLNGAILEILPEYTSKFESLLL